MIRNPRFWRQHARHLLGCAGALFILASCGGGGDAERQSAAANTDALRGALGADRRATAAGPSNLPLPVLFNASRSARAGQVVSLQGENFGSAPRVYFDGAEAAPLEIVNRVGTGWLAVRIPSQATGALIVRVANESGASAPVKLNAAQPLHLDTLQLSPGGAFRIFGRNLLLPGSMPSVTVNGLRAPLDLERSDEHMLVVTAPKTLKPATAVTVLVDNGNGSGSSRLERSVAAVAGVASDPFALGVGWANAFTVIANRSIDAATDSRLATKVACDGSRDDTAPIQQAIELAASSGGAVVRLPAGRCKLGGGISLRSKVVLQGAGRTATELVYDANYPLWAEAIDLAGVRDLTLSNSGASGEGPLLKSSTRVFLQRVGVRLGTSRQMVLTGNTHFVVAGCDFEQTGSISHQGPYLLNESAALVFEGNATRWMDGAPAFGRVRDSFIRGNRFTRDGRNQGAAGTVHSMTLDFAQYVAVVGNTFDVAGGPITNTGRNDGETILTEGGGGERTENLGSVASATATTLTDPANVLQVFPFGGSRIPENYGVAIVGGKGAGQTRTVVAYAAPTLTVDKAWDVIPDQTSRYAVFVWGLQKSLIKGNQLSQNPRGIWLYHTAIRDVEVVDNAISEGGGIYLRSYQNLATKSFMPIYNVLVARNRISNSNGIWMSYVNSVFVNADAKPFGIATIGVEMRANEVTANRPNAGSATEEYANTEGFMNMMRVENYDGYETSPTPRLLGSVLQDNACTQCDVAVRLGTGAGGSTVLGTRQAGGGVLWQDWATAGTQERSTDTVIR